MPNETLTDQQKNWMAKVRATLESSTGKTIPQWVEVARACPETKPRARQAWLKEHHGLGQNYAMMVLHALGEADGAPLRDTGSFEEILWAKPADRAIFEAVKAVVSGFPDLVVGQRKGFSAWSRKFQFAAMRPTRGGVRLGLALPIDADPRLIPAKTEGWSERCTATLVLTEAGQVDAGVKSLLEAAWEKS